jgi:microcystin-dependent protein
MSRNIFAGGGVQTFQGSNNPLYVQNMNSLKAAFTDLQDSISIAAPIGAVLMWSGACTLPADIPAGFAVCNGAYLDKDTYSTLYAIIGTRYGSLSGNTFPLPDLTSRIPRGTVGVPTPPVTSAKVTTSVSSAVDAHTHLVNSSFTAGNAASHTHAGGVLTAGSVNTSITAPGGANAAIGVNSSFTAGNAASHAHTVIGNTGDTNINHAHTTNVGNESNNHVHSYSKPNGSASSTTTGIQQTSGNHNHAVVVNVSNLSAHSHGILFNSGNQSAAVNSSFAAGNAADHTHSGGVLTAGNTNTSITAPGVPNADIAVNSSFTAGNATTISAPVLTHTHTTDITELVFIIKVI